MSRHLLVYNPLCVAGPNVELWDRTVAGLSARVDVSTLATSGHDDVARIAAAVRERRPDVVGAAGGDGTMNDVLNALRRAAIAPMPALAAFPIGTANVFGRSLGLLGYHHGDAAVARAVGVAAGGGRRRIDVGRVGDRYFGGAFTVGMDADILSLRNRLRRRLGLAGRRGSYALYLFSCAVNVFRAHAGRSRLVVDGVEESRSIFNLLVTNFALYAGEFRFDGDNDAADGRLDVVAVSGALEYLRVYPAAWRRHVRYERGETVAPAAGLRRAREIAIELPKPVAAQVDGEEIGPAAAYRVVVEEGGLEVCAG